MNDRRYDLDAWARARLTVHNLEGGRGHEDGVRIVSCPMCRDGDPKGHGWVNVLKHRGACFRPDCEAHGGFGALEYVRRVEGFRTRTEALAWLRIEHPLVGPQPVFRPRPYADWCELPREFRPIERDSRSVVQAEACAFAFRQWGVRVETLVEARAGFCPSGRHAWRIVLPIVLGGKLVAFVSRTFRGGEPKYLLAKRGELGELGAECGRPAEALLYGLDDVRPGTPVLLVEGPGDRLRWWQDHRSEQTPVAVLGAHLGEERLALLAARRPGLVIAAEDADGAAGGWAEALLAWGFAARRGSWAGGKDAGAGAQLASRDAGGLLARVRDSLDRRKMLQTL